MTVYMEVTRDAYELPVAVADSMCALARQIGVDVTSISRSVKKPHKYRHKYIRVELPDEEDEESDCEGSYGAD